MKAPGRASPKEISQTGNLALAGGGAIDYTKNFLDRSSSFLYFKRLLKEVQWKHQEIIVMSRKVMQPRLTAYMGEKEAAYRYSGTFHLPEPWHDVVLSIKKQVETATGCTFNSCLLNFYRDGKVYVSYHSDNESVYGPEPVIASLTLGATRDFLLKKKEGNSNNSTSGSSDSYVFKLAAGDLLVMRGGAVQRLYVHSVPKRMGVVGERINLTFRRVIHSNVSKS